MYIPDEFNLQSGSDFILLSETVRQERQNENENLRVILEIGLIVG